MKFTAFGSIKLTGTFLTTLMFIGCASPNLAPEPDTSIFSNPAKGNAGIYFYQQKSGVFGSVKDVAFVLNDNVLGQINTGEYLFFEVPSGSHKLRIRTNPEVSITVNFKERQTYFFAGAYSFPAERVNPMTRVERMAEVITYIKDGTYERGDID